MAQQSISQKSLESTSSSTDSDLFNNTKQSSSSDNEFNPNYSPESSSVNDIFNSEDDYHLFYSSNAELLDIDRELTFYSSSTPTSDNNSNMNVNIEIETKKRKHDDETQQQNQQHLSNNNNNNHISPSSPHLSPPTSEALLHPITTIQYTDRLSFLMALPKQICTLMNSGSDDELTHLVMDTFLPNAILKTPSLQHEIVGIGSIHEYFNAIIRTVPDLIMISSKPVLNFRVITVTCTCLGTSVRPDAFDYMYDCTKHAKDDSLSYRMTKDSIKHMISQNKHICFSSKSYLHFILNKEMTHVEKFVTVKKSLSVVESTVYIEALDSLT